ncbi:MAG: sigma-70 family RNA polymerase sigma factor [Burkholderiaceae bacterium]
MSQTGHGDNDARLMARYAQGDAKSFDLLYARHRVWLYRVLLRNLRDEALAQDVFQDTWLTIVRTASTYTPSAKFSTWLYGLARQRLIDQLRKLQTQPETAFATFNDEDAREALEDIADVQAPDPADRASWQQFGAALGAALADLPAEQREVFVLWVEADLTVEEIAQATQSSIEAAKSRLRYARAKLRAQLKAFG